MKNTILFALVSLFSAISLSSCKVEATNQDEGPVTTSTVDAKNFNSISIGYPADVVYIPADTFSVTVKASEQARNDLMISVSDSMLELNRSDVQKNSKHYIFYNRHYDDVTITIKAPTLKYVAIAGSGSFKCGSTITTPRLELAVAGSGKFDINNIRANDVKASIAGSGDIDANLTEVGKTLLEIAGSGDIDMHFRKCGSVKASIAGSGDIKLRGDVKSFSNEVAGAGDIDIDELTINK